MTVADDLAKRRGARAFSNNDIIFQFRHDKARVERLRTFLTWKAIRKTVKEPEDKDAFVDEAEMGLEAAGPSNDGVQDKAVVPVVVLPWDVSSFFSEQVVDASDTAESLNNEATIAKLRKNDEKTRNMTVAEYATWSEYRHASFTWRKAKRFREWSGLGVIADHRPLDDVPDILGFVTSEMVHNLTSEAMKMQQRELSAGSTDDAPGPAKKKTASGLFTQEDPVRPAVGLKHIRMAFQRLQTRPKRFRGLHNSTKRQQPAKLVLVCHLNF